jgi:hypothetical protein
MLKVIRNKKGSANSQNQPSPLQNPSAKYSVLLRALVDISNRNTKKIILLTDPPGQSNGQPHRSSGVPPFSARDLKPAFQHQQFLLSFSSG